MGSVRRAKFACVKRFSQRGFFHVRNLSIRFECDSIAYYITSYNRSWVLLILSMGKYFHWTNCHCLRCWKLRFLRFRKTKTPLQTHIKHAQIYRRFTSRMISNRVFRAELLFFNLATCIATCARVWSMAAAQWLAFSEFVDITFVRIIIILMTWIKQSCRILDTRSYINQLTFATHWDTFDASERRFSRGEASETF